MKFYQPSDPTRRTRCGSSWDRGNSDFYNTPADLDRLADAELQHGHHSVAERLSRLAAELREAQP